ncbi:methyltransferase domain-containing protein (plasmid) [Sphaerimonospora sp. CA-214678]|uniref:methyltransferase domain-containing protein n=1 Tax=Sphaerimonospora sp. CA-214678 TaxID=3240029 RepID=UPI003D926EEE
MLADAVRVTAFRNALAEVIECDDRVLDAGTGPGILAAIAAEFTSGPVVGVEYFADTAAFAASAAHASALERVRIVQGDVTRVDIGDPPDVVVSETIGALGPEENIVGLTYALRQRFPQVRAFVPSRLRVLAEPVVSDEADRLTASVIGAFSRLQPGGLSFEELLPEVELALGSQIVTTRLADAMPAGAPHTLVEYKLGETSDADFRCTVDLGGSAANAVHLYFEAVLGPTIGLSSHRTKPFTHWSHSYVARPSGARYATFSYKHAARRFSCRWAAGSRY